MPFKGKKSYTTNKKRKYRRYPAKKKKMTINAKIKKALNQYKGKEVHSYVDLMFNQISITYNEGVGKTALSYATEQLKPGTTNQQRIGNKITILGVKINYHFDFEGVSRAATFAELTEQSSCSFRILLVQMKEPIATTANYPWTFFKNQATINSALYMNDLLDLDNPNNPANRHRYKIIWEKRWTMGQALSTLLVTETGQTVIPVNTRYPHEIKGTKFIKGSKFDEVLWDALYEETPKTRSGGLMLVMISDQEDAQYFNAPRASCAINVFFSP